MFEGRADNCCTSSLSGKQGSAKLSPLRHLQQHHSKPNQSQIRHDKKLDRRWSICAMLRGSQLLRIARAPNLDHLTQCAPQARRITTSLPLWVKKMPDRPKLVDEAEFTESFLKGSGPGGQKIARSSIHTQLGITF